jgi:hypothetical protein
MLFLFMSLFSVQPEAGKFRGERAPAGRDDAAVRVAFPDDRVVDDRDQREQL